jgi:UDP-N-acetylglucosamine 2-epimerase (non-hydrolysing)
MKRTVVCVVGTRPEAVKMAPVVLRLRREAGLLVRVLATGQHRELLGPALGDFGHRRGRRPGRHATRPGTWPR